MDTIRILTITPELTVLTIENKTLPVITKEVVKIITLPIGPKGEGLRGVAVHVSDVPPENPRINDIWFMLQ